MIIWSGHGILIPVFAVIGLISGSMLGIIAGGEKSGPSIGLMLGGIFSTGLVWLYALTLGKPQESVLLDPATGRQVLYRKSHTFFFIPAFAWAVISSVLAVLIVGSGILAMVAGPSEPKALAPGAAELSAAERLISGKSSGILHGNTPEAKAMAKTFSELASTMRDELIEKGSSSKVSLTGGEFLTYCQSSGHGVAFLVHVPSLRKFSDEAKQVMCDAAWFAANQAVAGMNPPPANLAVGVRGVILYESILVGTPASGSVDEPTAGLKSRHKSTESDVLLSFFAPSEGASDGIPPAKNPASNDTSATIETSSAANGPGSNPVETPAVGEAKSTTAAVTPAPGGPESLPVPPPGSPEQPVTDAAVAVVTLPTEMKEWKSLDGRILKASLIRFTDTAGTSAEFKREDGQLFTIPLDRFAPESAEEMRKIHQGLSAR